MYCSEVLEDCISSASGSDSISHNFAKRAVTSFFKSYPCVISRGRSVTNVGRT